MVKVPARTLTSLLDEHGITQVDFVNLDVEGYELEVLKGFDLEKWKPKYLMIEVYSKDQANIERYLEAHHYQNIRNMSDFNLQNNPLWDGSHNDYLFKRMR